MTIVQIDLASQSPRRAELLRQLGLRFRVVKVDVDESARSGEDPAACALRLAQTKAQAALRKIGENSRRPLLAADTLVAVDGGILGKPRNRAEALAMLARLSGRRHQVHSAVVLWSDNELRSAHNLSEVTFRIVTPQEASDYWQTNEPADKAGAYAIQGRAAQFVERLDGSYSGVMGLPLFETAALLREAGIRIL